MTWARIDDQLMHSPEWVALGDAALTIESGNDPAASPPTLRDRARRLACLSKSVHLISLGWAVPALTDGRLSAAGTEQICATGSFSAEEWYAGAELLVEVGAWRKLRPTKRDPLGAFQMVLGFAPGEQPTRAEDVSRRAMNTLRGRLRDGRADAPNKVAAVARAHGRCEYCDARVGADGGQIDHVDPTLMSNGVDNLAHVCPACNKHKGNHQLIDVGMSFTPRALAARQSVTRGVTRASRKTPSVPGTGGRRSRSGSGRGGQGLRVGSGKGSGSGRGPAAEGGGL